MITEGPTTAEALREAWSKDARWAGIKRPYSPEDVLRLQPSVNVRYTLAERGSRRLWELLHSNDYINTMGAMTGKRFST
jgi:isocitrate lyase